uniref:Copper-containing nitrite reductase n=2 Tax=environmental samples TaxID=48509 RepID=D4N705_9CREN|nr:copper-containing nitrite reductase [uncultured crenarchaeote 29d5]
MNRSLLLASSLIASFLLASSIAFVPYFSANNVVRAQETENQGEVKHITLIASEKQVQVAPDNALHPGGIMYNAMVFNGTIPGPVISIDQGDTLNITLKNEGQTIHSLDFHAGFGPSKAVSGSVKPGESKTWSLTGEFPGVFMYHCGADGLNGVWEHISNGMYGGIVVHPTNEEPAKEFYMVFSEIYNSADKGPFVGTNGTAGSFDIGKFISKNPDLVLTNGMSHKYVPAVGEVNKLELNKDAEIFKVKPGELTRWYIVNPGPNDGVSFHFISGILSVKDGSNTANNGFGTQDINDETWWIPPGSGSVIESTFPEGGVYVGVDHAMADVVKGGAFAVLAVENSTATDHPEGTCVPAKGEGIVCTAAEAEETQAEGAAGENQTATDDEGNEAEDKGANNNENGNEAEDGDSEVTQNATMLNTTGGNTTANGTMMAGNMTGNMTGDMGGNSTMGS